jgi:peroxiredoxin
MPLPPLTPLVPRQPVPPLDVPLVGGGRWRLAERTPARFTMLVFYRGLHCPVCAGYLRDLAGRLDAFAARGVDVLALSGDAEDRAEAAVARWQLGTLPVGYELAPDAARRWGLYLSRGRGPTSAGVDEPALFSEPALYLVRPDGTLYFGAVQTMPFARPHFADVLGALDFVIAKDYPARGEVADGDMDGDMDGDVDGTVPAAHAAHAAAPAAAV